MRRCLELEVSEHIVLECKSCGERVVLLGHEDDWHSEGRGAFACGCGAELTLADRLGDADRTISRLTRGQGST